MKFLKTIGITSNQPVGRGFNFPYDLAINHHGKSEIVLYMLNRGPSNSNGATRIQYFTLNEKWLGEFGHNEVGLERLSRPVAMAFNSNQILFVTDEASDEIKLFDSEGNFIRAIKVNDMNNPDSLEPVGPAGITIDSNNNIFVVSRYGNFVQKLNEEGDPVIQWGSRGAGISEFNMPWGLDADNQGNIYVADWRNDRIQKFDSGGNFIKILGKTGFEPGEFNRPSSVSANALGQIAVADWGNERVQILDAEGYCLQVLEGSSELSLWSKEWLNANLDEQKARSRANLKEFNLPKHLTSAYHRASQTEHKFWGPVSVKFDLSDRLYVTEHSRHRLQIFEME